MDEFKGTKIWSERMKNVFMAIGKRWNEDVEKDVKGLIADSVAQDPTNALLPYNRSSVDGLVDQLENLIQKAA